MPYTLDRFAELGPNTWVLDAGTPAEALCVGREGQTLAEFVDEMNAPAAPVLAIDDYSAAIQNLLDAKARERQYDSLLTAVSYVDDPNPAYAAEAAALKAWRSAVWTYALAALADVQDGEREAPTVEAFIAEVAGACPFSWPS